MTVIYGVVKQNMILLPEGTELQDDDTVEIRLRSPRRATKKQPQAEALFKQRLLQLGLLSRLPKSATSLRKVIEPIEIPGPPLSEQIIADRR